MKETMTTREVYYKVYAESELPVGMVGFASKDKRGVIQLFQSVWLCFHDGHEGNIKKMEKISKEKNFMFWNNSPEGIRTVQENLQKIRRY